MFPYCCLLIICIMLFPCSVFKVHLSLFAQRSSSFERTSFNEQGKLRSIWNQLLADVRGSWWAKVDSNHRPHYYQSCALASWAIGPRQNWLRIARFGLTSKTHSLRSSSSHNPDRFAGSRFCLDTLDPPVIWKVVEISGIEPLTSCLQGRRSPSWAKPPSRRTKYAL